MLAGFEEDESVFWDERRHEVEKRLADPDDVFFAGRDRKQEIKEQIKQLERGLAASIRNDGLSPKSASGLRTSELITRKLTISSPRVGKPGKSNPPPDAPLPRPFR